MKLIKKSFTKRHWGCLQFFPERQPGFLRTARCGAGQRVYYGIFDHDIPGDDAGSFHGSELWFMFDSLGNSWRPFEGKHYDLARQVASYWTNFVKNLDPNGRDYNGNPLPVWEPYQKENKAVMRFLDKATPEALPECPILDFRLAFGKEVFADGRAQESAR